MLVKQLVLVAQYAILKGMADDELKDQRVPIMMSASELRQVDEWRRRHNELPSRSEAIRQLIALGLGQAESVRRVRRADNDDRPPKSRK
jgi:hypothetical protein